MHKGLDWKTGRDIDPAGPDLSPNYEQALLSPRTTEICGRGEKSIDSAGLVSVRLSGLSVSERCCHIRYCRVSAWAGPHIEVGKDVQRGEAQTGESGCRRKAEWISASGCDSALYTVPSARKECEAHWRGADVLSSMSASSVATRLLDFI